VSAADRRESVAAVLAVTDDHNPLTIVTKSERLCMYVTCGYATYITLGAIPVLLLLCYPFSDCSGCISGYV